MRKYYPKNCVIKINKLLLIQTKQMKKLLLLLSMPLMAFQYTPANLSDCDGDTPIVHIKGTPYWYNFELECN